jgi:hypothetical protein
MHDNWQFALTLAAIIAGIFFNQKAADRVRTDLTGTINTMFGTLKADIAMLTGKVMELTDRVSALEVKLEDKH